MLLYIISHHSLPISTDVNVSPALFELHELRVNRCVFPKLLRRPFCGDRNPLKIRLRRPECSRRSIAHVKVNKNSQVHRPSPTLGANPPSREIVSLTASCNALPVASRSGRAKAGLHASSLARTFIRKVVGRLDVFEGDRLGVEINHRIKWKC